MNNAVKNILIFLIGAGAGAIITYKVLEEQFEQRLQDEIDALYNDPVEEMTDEEYSERVNEITENYRSADHVVPIHSRRVGKHTAYNEMYKGSTPPEDVRKFGEESGFYPPYIIPQDLFEQETLHFDKVTLLYYAKDDVVTETDEEVVSNPEELIGVEALVRFGADTLEDPDTVHVRNEILSIDYEIIRIDKSYSEEVLGINDARPPVRRGNHHEERESED